MVWSVYLGTVASHKKFLQRKQQVDELFAFGIVSN